MSSRFPAAAHAIPRRRSESVWRIRYRLVGWGARVFVTEAYQFGELAWRLALLRGVDGVLDLETVCEEEI